MHLPATTVNALDTQPTEQTPHFRSLLHNFSSVNYNIRKLRLQANNTVDTEAQ